MPTIPVWVVQIVKLAISIGSPYLLKLIQGWIKNLPPAVVELINDLIKSLLDPAVSNSDAKQRAKSKLKECVGVACTMETKSDK